MVRRMFCELYSYIPQPPVKKQKRGGTYSEQKLVEIREEFPDHFFGGKTPSMKECEKFLQKYPHPEKGRTAQDIQDKAKRMIDAEGKPRKKKK